MTRPTIAIINLAALNHNLQQVKKVAPHSKVMAMVKSNAYGHGLSICPQLVGTDALGVACLEEALSLRQMSETRRIILLEGFFEACELTDIAQHQFEIVVHQQWQIDCLLQQRLALPVKVWLKIDTGMHRLGFLPKDFAMAYQRLQQQPNVRQPVNLMSHFASANEQDQLSIQRQQASFTQLTADLPGEKTLANSAAIMAYPQTHLDWVRPGIMLYGVSPFAGQTAQSLNLHPVMQLQSRILAINDYQAGDCIGYGGEYCCQHAMRVAVIPIGYGDGYPREAPSGTPVLIHGQRCPIIGRVSMDMMSIDISNVQAANIGDQVILWGKGLPIEEVASAIGTIAYTLFCSVTRRVHFEHFSP